MHRAPLLSTPSRGPAFSSRAAPARPQLRVAAEPALQKPMARPTPGAAEPPKAPSPAGSSAAEAGAGGITLRYQRDQAKAMQRYFAQLAEAETADRAKFFGWTKANEISNGRWVMFGWFVGLLTEYATGVDFPHQFALMSTYLGILDLE